MSNLINLCKKILVYSYPVIVLIGIITNSLSFIIFSRKRFQNTIFSTYFRCFIVFQTLSLIFLPINKMFELNLNIYFDSNVSNFICKLRYFYGYFNIANAAWFLVIISIDRWISISNPTKFMFRKKIRFQMATCLSIILFNVCLLTPTWFYYIKQTTTFNNNNNDTNINLFCSSHSVWIDFIEMFHQVLIPFVLMILFTFLTATYVFKSRKIMHNSSSNNKTSSNNNDRKFAISSITINILFLIFNFPHFLLYMLKEYSDLFDNSIESFKLIESFSYFLLYINLISTFFINQIVNTMFKTELKIVIQIMKKILS